MTRRNQVLLGVLALQAALLIAVFWPRSAGPGIERLLEGLEEPDVVAVTIADDRGDAIRLVRAPFGCVLPEADDYPCAKNRLSDFLRRVTPLTTASLLADSEASHARLKVAADNYERVVDLETSDGSRHKFYLGTSPRGRSGHIRLDGQERAYLAPGLSAFDAPTRPDAWVDPAYFSIPQDTAAAIAVANSAGNVAIRKDENGAWMLEGGPDAPAPGIDPNKARKLATAAANVRLVRPLGKAEKDSYGLSKPSAIVVVSSGGEEHEIRIGARFGDEGYVAKSSESPYYVVVSEETARELMDATAESLLAAPAAPTPDAPN